MGNRHPSIAPYELLRTGDGDVVLAVGNDRQFRLLCEVLGVPALAQDPRFNTNPARVANRDDLVQALERELARRPAGEWVPMLTAARVPAGQVNDIEEAFELAQRLGLQPIVELPDDSGAIVRLPRNPIGLQKTPPSYRSAPPRMP
jgi:crotonobetainyl-CoA:carnitine CoA-transferase CaiB-like acyl-CoA transferase